MVRRLPVASLVFLAACHTTTRPAAIDVRGQKPDEPADALTLAADCLGRGDDAGAATHLKRHVVAHPDHVVFRSQLAEIQGRLGNWAEAQAEYEAAVRLAQAGTKLERLVHYHTRLMEICRQRDDAYGEPLHRGIGLFLVATELRDRGSPTDAQRLWCKAAAALAEARERRPDEARPAWYLHRTWVALDQPRPAEKCLAVAKTLAPFSRLTPVEAEGLEAATRGQTR